MKYLYTLLLAVLLTFSCKGTKSGSIVVYKDTVVYLPPMSVDTSTVWGWNFLPGDTIIKWDTLNRTRIRLIRHSDTIKADCFVKDSALKIEKVKEIYNNTQTTTVTDWTLIYIALGIIVVLILIILLKK